MVVPNSYEDPSCKLWSQEVLRQRIGMASKCSDKVGDASFQYNDECQSL